MIELHNYPGDISREQFEIICPDLECAKKKKRPRTYDLYDVYLSAVKNFLVDGGYSGKNFADSVKDIHGATVEVVKSDLPEFTVIPKRWIVEHKLHTSLQMTVLALLALILRRF